MGSYRLLAGLFAHKMGSCRLLAGLFAHEMGSYRLLAGLFAHEMGSCRLLQCLGQSVGAHLMGECLIFTTMKAATLTSRIPGNHVFFDPATNLLNNIGRAEGAQPGALIERMVVGPSKKESGRVGIARTC